MTIGLLLRFDGVGEKEYDDVMRVLGLSSPGATGGTDDWPKGIVSHVAGNTGDGWCVVDIWESQADFDAFFASRLGPALEKVGTLPQPLITPFEVYNTGPS
ncbi:MAG TPA: hypothetical protein VFA94_00530 [Acidimicrobiales bacterium]|nr:hypothetical protein [Acidimicrobiales bacterium]